MRTKYAHHDVYRGYVECVWKNLLPEKMETIITMKQDLHAGLLPPSDKEKNHRIQQFIVDLLHTVYNAIRVKSPPCVNSENTEGTEVNPTRRSKIGSIGRTHVKSFVKVAIDRQTHYTPQNRQIELLTRYHF